MLSGKAFFWAAVLVSAFGVGQAYGDGLVLPGKGTKTTKAARTALLNQQLAVLDTRAATQYSASIRLTPQGKNAKAGDGVTILPGHPGNYKSTYLAAAKAAAQRHGVPEALFLRLVQQESGWNHRATSPKGATGLAQLMPATAARLGVDESDPHQNLDGGARYLRMMYDRFGDWKLALAAYNAGPEAVEKYGGVPPYAETTHYVKAILGG